MKCPVQCAQQQESPFNIPKYCACHERSNAPTSPNIARASISDAPISPRCACHDKYQSNVAKNCARRKKQRPNVTKLLRLPRKVHSNITKCCHEKPPSDNGGRSHEVVKPKDSNMNPNTVQTRSENQLLMLRPRSQRLLFAL